MIDAHAPKLRLQSLEVASRHVGVVELALDVDWNSKAHVEERALAVFQVETGQEGQAFEIRLDVRLGDAGEADVQGRVWEELERFTLALHDAATVGVSRPRGRPQGVDRRAA